MELLKRIGRDLRRRRNIEAYVIAAVSVVFAALSLVGDLVGDDLRWAAVLSALGLLIYRVADPVEVVDVDRVLHSRVSFENISLASRFRNAETVWIYGPSAIHLLTAATGDLRRTVLARPNGVVRVAILDPGSTEAVALAARQLDDRLEYRVDDMRDALDRTVARLEVIACWDTAGTIEHRFVPFNPGFSLVAIDPHGPHGVVIVEFHGVHNESDLDRMHIELSRRTSEHWYDYWTDQFEHIWSLARLPGDPTG